MAYLQQEKLIRISSVLTRPNDTTAYTANDLIASSVTAGSVVVPSFPALPNLSAEGLRIEHGIIRTSLVTGFTTSQLSIDLWSAAPTFTNGDNGAYAVATGAANWLGRLTSAVSDAFSGGVADGGALDVHPGTAYVAGVYPDMIFIPINRNASIFWSLRDVVGFTPAALQTFTLELLGYQS
jgi:hypothetical protein